MAANGYWARKALILSSFSKTDEFFSKLKDSGQIRRRPKKKGGTNKGFLEITHILLFYVSSLNSSVTKKIQELNIRIN